MKNKLMLLVVLVSYPAVQAMSTETAVSQSASLEKEAGARFYDWVRECKKGNALSSVLDSWNPKDPDLEALEAVLKREVSGDALSRELGKCLWRRGVDDFNGWLPAMQLLVSYGADPDGVNSHFIYGNTLLLGALTTSNLCRDWKIPYYRQVIEFLIRTGASITRRNEAGEDAIDLALNPSKLDSVDVRRSEKRLEQYYWFKKTAARILSENNRIKELEFLENYRLPEEQEEADRRIDDGLKDVFCPNITKIIGGYAKAKSLKLCRYGDELSGRKGIFEQVADTCAIS